MALTTAREIDVTNAIVAEINSVIQPTSGLTFAALRVWSFGFTDGQLATLRVVARPIDTEKEGEARQDEQHDYEIQIGVFKFVARSDVTNIDSYFNLLVTIAKLYPLDRKLVVGGGTVTAIDNRFFPMYRRSDKIMDNPDSATTRFEGTVQIKFREWVAE